MSIEPKTIAECIDAIYELRAAFVIQEDRFQLLQQRAEQWSRTETLLIEAGVIWLERMRHIASGAEWDPDEDARTEREAALSEEITTLMAEIGEDWGDLDHRKGEGEPLTGPL